MGRVGVWALGAAGGAGAARHWAISGLPVLTCACSHGLLLPPPPERIPTPGPSTPQPAAVAAAATGSASPARPAGRGRGAVAGIGPRTATRRVPLGAPPPGPLPPRSGGWRGSGPRPCRCAGCWPGGETATTAPPGTVAAGWHSLAALGGKPAGRRGGRWGGRCTMAAASASAAAASAGVVTLSFSGRRGLGRVFWSESKQPSLPPLRQPRRSGSAGAPRVHKKYEEHGQGRLESWGPEEVMR
jgi:hypothetical protein